MSLTEYEPENKPAVLFISTHGAYKENVYTNTPDNMNIHKINAVILDTTNYTSPYIVNHMAFMISRMIEDERLNNIDDGSIWIQTIIKIIEESNSLINQPLDKILSKDKKGELHTYINNSDRAYQINYFKSNETILDKTYITYNDETSTQIETNNNNKILLFNNGQQVDLMTLVDPRLQVNASIYSKELKLSDILTYVNNLNITNVIIIDLSCSNMDCVDKRHARVLNRTNNYGGTNISGYKRKIKKKSKKTKTTKITKIYTKCQNARRTTCKINRKKKCKK